MSETRLLFKVQSNWYSLDKLLKYSNTIVNILVNFLLEIGVTTRLNHFEHTIWKENFRRKKTNPESNPESSFKKTLVVLKY